MRAVQGAVASGVVVVIAAGNERELLGFGCDPLQQRPACHGRDAVPGAAGREQGERRRGRRDDPERRDGKPEEGCATGQRRRQPAAPNEAHRGQGADDPAKAECGGEKAGPGRARPEEVDGRRHEQDVERARDDHRSRKDHDEEQDATLAPKDDEAADGIPEDFAGTDRPRGRRRDRDDRQPADEDGANRADAREERENVAGLGPRQEQARDERSQEEGNILGEPRDRIRRGQVAGRVGQAREDRRLDGPRDREGGGGRGREQEDQRNGSPRVERDRRRREGQCLQEAGDQQDAVAPEAIARIGGERRHDARRHELDHREQGRGGRAADRISEDEDRGPRGVLGHVEAEIGDLEARQGWVAGNGEDDPELLPHRTQG